MSEVPQQRNTRGVKKTREGQLSRPTEMATSLCAIGSRTGEDILAGKKIHVDQDGFHNFSDYWSETDDDSVLSWPGSDKDVSTRTTTKPPGSATSLHEMSSFASSSRSSTFSETERLLQIRGVGSGEFPTPMNTGSKNVESLQRGTVVSDVFPEPVNQMAQNLKERSVSDTARSNTGTLHRGREVNSSPSVQIENKLCAQKEEVIKQTSAGTISITAVVASASQGLIVSGTDITGSLTKDAISEPPASALPASALKNAKIRRKISYSEEETKKSMQNAKLRRLGGGCDQVHRNESDDQNVIDNCTKECTIVSKEKGGVCVPDDKCDSQISSMESIQHPVNTSIHYPHMCVGPGEKIVLDCVEVPPLGEVNQREPNESCVEKVNELMRKSMQDQNGIKEAETVQTQHISVCVKPSNLYCTSVLIQRNQVQPTDRSVRRVTMSVGQQFSSSESEHQPGDKNMDCSLIKAQGQIEVLNAANTRINKRARKPIDKCFEALPVNVSKSKQQSKVGAVVGGMNSQNKKREVKSGNIHSSRAQSNYQQSVNRTKDNNSDKLSSQSSINDHRELAELKSRKKLLQKYCHDEADHVTELHLGSDPQLHVSSLPAAMIGRITKEGSGLASPAQELWERSISTKRGKKTMRLMHDLTPQSLMSISLASSTKDNVEVAPEETAHYNSKNIEDETDKLLEDAVSASSGFAKMPKNSKCFEDIHVSGTCLRVIACQAVNKIPELSNVQPDSKQVEHKRTPTCRDSRKSPAHSDMMDIDIVSDETRVKPSSVPLRKSSTFAESTLSDFEDESFFFSLKKPVVDNHYLEDTNGNKYKVVDDNEIVCLKSFKKKKHIIRHEKIVDKHPEAMLQGNEEKIGYVVTDTKVVDNQNLNIVTLDGLETNLAFQTEDTATSKLGCKTSGKKKNTNKKFVDSLCKNIDIDALASLPKPGHLKKRPSLHSDVSEILPLVSNDNRDVLLPVKADDWTLSDEAVPSSEMNKSTQEEEMDASKSFNFDEFIPGQLESIGLPTQRFVQPKTDKKQERSSHELKKAPKKRWSRSCNSSKSPQNSAITTNATTAAIPVEDLDDSDIIAPKKKWSRSRNSFKSPQNSAITTHATTAAVPVEDSDDSDILTPKKRWSRSRNSSKSPQNSAITTNATTAAIPVEDLDDSDIIAPKKKWSRSRNSFKSPQNSAITTHATTAAIPVEDSDDSDILRTVSTRSILKKGCKSTLGTPRHYCEVTFSEPPISRGGTADPVSKIIKPTQSPKGLRRSQRTRVKPLEWYKNERILYKKRQSGGFVVDGVGSPICKNKRECNYMARMMSAKQKLTAYGKRLKTARQKAKRLSIHTNLPADMKFVETEGEIPVINPSSGEECIINCVASKNSYVYTGPTGLEPAPGDALMIAKPIKQLAFGCGELIIKPLMEKLTQFVHSDTLECQSLV
ncbi:uncharacterized protein LOC135485978 isoform X2 [Lineus longissimus]|uniref:uncharacterized protein LOC135485978 isoform X2 n=1 Tax=Lineus longissimus TaxID=88925 RepID=UPI00315DEEF6